jgi:hypothetical protein
MTAYGNDGVLEVWRALTLAMHFVLRLHHGIDRRSA